MSLNFKHGFLRKKNESGKLRTPPPPLCVCVCVRGRTGVYVLVFNLQANVLAAEHIGTSVDGLSRYLFVDKRWQDAVALGIRMPSE